MCALQIHVMLFNTLSQIHSTSNNSQTSERFAIVNFEISTNSYCCGNFHLLKTWRSSESYNVVWYRGSPASWRCPTSTFTSGVVQRAKTLMSGMWQNYCQWLTLLQAFQTSHFIVLMWCPKCERDPKMSTLCSLCHRIYAAPHCWS